MALSGSTVWEVESGGSDTNGAGCFDPSQTAGMFTDGAATSATGNSPVFSSASYNFVAGDVGAWVYVAAGTNWKPGWYKIASVGSNVATLEAAVGAAVRSWGLPNATAGVATTASPTGATWAIDYSQQTATRFTYTDLSAAGAGLTVSSAGNPFAAQQVGNGIVVTGGTNFTTGRYVIASVSAGVATVVGAGNITTGASSNGAGRQGGALASPGMGASLMLPSNWCFVKAATYNITTTTPGAAGPVLYAPGTDAAVTAPSLIEGYATVRGDKGTKPLLRLQASLTSSAISIMTMYGTTNKYVRMTNFELDANTGNTTATGLTLNSNFQFASRFKISHTTALGVFMCDQYQYLEDTEVANFSGTAGISLANTPYVSPPSALARIYVHDGTSTTGIAAYNASAAFYDTIVANITGDGTWSGVGTRGQGITLDNSSSIYGGIVYNVDQAGIGTVNRTNSTGWFVNLIVYGCGGFGVEADGTQGCMRFLNCAFGNNTSGDFDADIPEYAKVNLVTLTADPFVDGANGDFRLNNTAGGGAACRAAGVPGPLGSLSGYRDIGVLQHQDTAGSGTKITALSELTAPDVNDILAIVDDPAGTPVTMYAKIANILKLGLTTVAMQKLTSASGTYTPTTGMKYALVIAQGSGAGGKSVTLTDEAGGGGGAGGTCVRLFTAAEIVGHDGYTVGASAAADGAGNNTTFSSSPTLLTASGGAVGTTTGNTTTVGIQGAGGAGGAATGGDLNIPGEAGGAGIMFSTTACLGGAGGRAVLGAGGGQTGNAAAGANGTGYGGGGAGATTSDDTNRSGGTGAAGVIYVIEFIGA